MSHCRQCQTQTNRCTQVRDWYVESFKDLRAFAPIKDSSDEALFTDLLKHIYNRHKVRLWMKYGS